MIEATEELKLEELLFGFELEEELIMGFLIIVWEGLA